MTRVTIPFVQWKTGVKMRHADIVGPNMEAARLCLQILFPCPPSRQLP